MYIIKNIGSSKRRRSFIEKDIIEVKAEIERVKNEGKKKSKNREKH